MSNERQRPIGPWFTAIAASTLVALATLGYLVGDGYIDRLPNHDGYFLVEVTTTVDGPPLQRPERTVVLVIDGLREDAARSTRAAERLADAGWCHSTDVGDLTISRPIYAVFSTGLEADRTGVRNNDETRPIRPVSIWQTAREAGITVRGYSQLAWWRELFPDAFTQYTMDEDHATDLFAVAELSDLTLVHPTYVDETAHDHGADSDAYRESVVRVDGEVGRLLDRIDLARDAVIFTADHGHVAAGGHGADGPQVARVLTCMAGRGVARAPTLPDDALDIRVLAPTLAVLLGVPLPPHMRAGGPGEDNLDQIWPLLDSTVLGTDYVAARRANVEQVRRGNEAQIMRWLGGDDSRWQSIYVKERAVQLKRATASVMVIIFVLLASLWLRRLTLAEALGSVGWVVAAVVVPATIYTIWRGSFDFSSINARALFVRVSITSCLAGGLVVIAAHALLFRDRRRLVFDLITATAIVVALSLAHQLVYGIPLGFPLPTRGELFFPFFASAFSSSFGMIGAAATIAGSILARLRS